MASVNEEKLKSNIAKSPQGIYLLFGEDNFLKKNYADKIGKKVAEADDVFNYCKFTGDCNLQDVYDAVIQLPIMSEKKFVELCDFDFEHCSANEFGMLCELVRETPETTVFVIRFNNIEVDVKKNKKFQKLISEVENNGGLAVNLEHRGAPELMKMLMDGAIKRGTKMDRSTSQYLIETVGDDIELLKNELAKLCAFNEGNTITKETVDNVAVKTVEASIYNLSNFILAADISNSVACLNELLFMRIEPLAILHTVSSVYIDLVRMYSAKKAGLTVEDVSAMFDYGNKKFVLKRASEGLNKFDFKRLDLSLNALLDADKLLKSNGCDGKIVLEQLIIRLIYIIVKGESVD